MRKVASLLTVLAGLLVLVHSLNLAYSPITAALATISMRTKLLAIALSLIPLLVALGIALYLLVARERIASWFVPDEDSSPSLGASDLLRAGLVLLGVYLIATAIPVLLALVISPFASWLQMRANTVYGQVDFAGQGLGAWLASNVPSIASSLASLGLGVFLVLKRDYLIGRMSSARDRIEPDAAPMARCPHCGASYDPADYDGGLAVPRCVVCKGPLDVGSARE